MRNVPIVTTNLKNSEKCFHQDIISFFPLSYSALIPNQPYSYFLPSSSRSFSSLSLYFSLSLSLLFAPLTHFVLLFFFKFIFIFLEKSETIESRDEQTRVFPFSEYFLSYINGRRHSSWRSLIVIMLFCYAEGKPIVFFYRIKRHILYLYIYIHFTIIYTTFLVLLSLVSIFSRSCL